MTNGRNMEPHEIEQVLSRIIESHEGTETLLEVAQEHGQLSARDLSMEARSRHVNTNSCMRSIAQQFGGDMTLSEAIDEANERFMTILD